MATTQLESFVSAARRMGGAYGLAFIGGVAQTDILEVAANVEMGRADVLLVGQRRTGQKMTRISIDGTLSTQKIDDRWELFVYNMTSISDVARIAARDAGNLDLADPTFDLKLSIDDPQAYGRSSWQLNRCRIWSYSMGSSQSDDTIEKQYPLTWESEAPIEAFEIHTGGVKVQKYLGGNQL